ncbi:MAG: hypothetical protein M5R41_17820 [Bacteroidia bacterium]|nr:hypothetical protein [Bacteroidia bacterium]
MKRIRHIAVRLLVLPLLVVATTGVPMSWHLCSMSGTVTVSSDCDMHAAKATACCNGTAADERPSVARTACCVEFDKTVQLSDEYTVPIFVPTADLAILPVDVADDGAADLFRSFTSFAREIPPGDPPPSWLLTGSFLS